MDNKDRDQLRKLQDRVVKMLLNSGYDEGSKLGVYDGNLNQLRVKDLQEKIYPLLEREFKEYVLDNND